MSCSEILLSVNQFSPRQFDKLFIVISSNEVGVFNLELSYPSSTTVPGGLLGQDEVRMEDLLGAQYENKERLDMFEGQAAFSLNMLIHQINKSKSHHFGVTADHCLRNAQNSTIHSMIFWGTWSIYTGAVWTFCFLPDLGSSRYNELMTCHTLLNKLGDICALHDDR